MGYKLSCLGFIWSVGRCAYVKVINTRAELLVKSLNICLKTVYHADSYNAMSAPHDHIRHKRDTYQKIFHIVGIGTKLKSDANVLFATHTGCPHTTYSLSLNDAGEGPKFPPGQKIVCHFSQGTV